MITHQKAMSLELWKCISCLEIPRHCMCQDFDFLQFERPGEDSVLIFKDGVWELD